MSSANYPAGAFADPNAPYNDDHWKEYEQEMQLEELGVVVIPFDVVTVPPEAQIPLDKIYLKLIKGL